MRPRRIRPNLRKLRGTTAKSLESITNYPAAVLRQSMIDSVHAMGDPETYRKRADECAVLADSCATSQHKAVWLELQQHWLRLADTLELFGRVDPFAAFLMTGPSRSGTH